jgi:hypothetical protein
MQSSVFKLLLYVNTNEHQTRMALTHTNVIKGQCADATGTQA